MSGFLPSGALAQMRATAERSMGDTCVRRAWTEARDSNNQEGEDWVDAETFACGYQPARNARVSQTDSRESTTNVVMTAPVLRLPLVAATVFTSRDRVRLTHRAGVALTTPLDYGIQGDLAVGPTAVVAVLTGEHT